MVRGGVTEIIYLAMSGVWPPRTGNTTAVLKIPRGLGAFVAERSFALLYSGWGWQTGSGSQNGLNRSGALCT